MRNKLGGVARLFLTVSILLAACTPSRAKGPEGEPTLGPVVTLEGSTPTQIIDALATTEIPDLDSNIIPTPTDTISTAEPDPTVVVVEPITLPTTLAELNLTESGGSDAQVAESLRSILAYDSDGDGTNDRNGYDDRWGVIVANLWVNGQLGEGIETYEQAVEVAKDMFSDVATVNGERWSVQPRNIATGEIGVAYDPETGLPYPSGMSLSGDWTAFETRFFPSPAGGGEQIVAGDSDEESFTLVAKDEKTGKPRWVLVNGKWREDPKWNVSVEIASMDQFERQTYWEQGTAIAVEDLYGAGPATIRVEKVTEAEPGQVLEYQEFDFLNQPSSKFGSRTLDHFALYNLTVEATSLLRVDIEDNAQVADGTLCVMRLGTLIQGKHTSFEVVVNGDPTHDQTGESMCRQWSAGDLVDTLRLEFFATGGVTLEDLISSPYTVDDPGDIDDILFARLGEGSVPFNSAKILKAVREGGILDKSMMLVGSIR